MVLIESNVPVLKALLQLYSRILVLIEISLGFKRQHFDIRVFILFYISVTFEQVACKLSNVHEWDLSPSLRVKHLNTTCKRVPLFPHNHGVLVPLTDIALLLNHPRPIRYHLIVSNCPLQNKLLIDTIILPLLMLYKLI